MRLKTTHTRRSAIAAAIVVAALGAGCGSAGGGDDGDGPITLGMPIPMSGSSSAIGPYMRNGAELAIKEINAKGGVDGRKLELDVQDDACDPKTAAAAASKLVSSGVAGSVGGYCSGATLPTLSIFDRANIPVLIPAANSTELADQKLPNVFLLNGTGKQQAEAAAKWFEEQGAKRVALMNDTTSYSKDIADRTAALLEAPGGPELTKNEATNPGESDYSAAVTAVLRGNPDVVYWTGYYQEGGLVIRQLRQAGYDGTIVVADGAVDKKLIDIAGRANAQGVYATVTPTGDAVPGAAKWIDKYRKAFGEDPGPFSTQSYDAVRLMADAIERAGSTDGDKVAAALAEVDGFPSLAGPVKFSEDHTLRNNPFVVLQVEDESFKLP